MSGTCRVCNRGCKRRRHHREQVLHQVTRMYFVPPPSLGRAICSTFHLKDPLRWFLLSYSGLRSIVRPGDPSLASSLQVRPLFMDWVQTPHPPQRLDTVSAQRKRDETPARAARRREGAPGRGPAGWRSRRCRR